MLKFLIISIVCFVVAFAAYPVNEFLAGVSSAVGTLYFGLFIYEV